MIEKMIKNFLINLRNIGSAARLMKKIEELESKNKGLNKKVQEMEKLFSLIAHDLRSPFVGLLGLTELLKYNYNDLTAVERKESSRMINKQAQKIFALLENLLDWSKMRLGKQPISLANISLKEIGDNVIGLLQLNADEKQVSLHNDVSAEIIIYADANTIQAVIRNLVFNAIKFTNPEGRIIISAITIDGFVSVSVTDTGIGVKPENLEKLFGPKFYSTKGTNDEGGTGLGLRLCQSLIKEQGGTIFASSVLGKGTVMTFTAKLARP
ncbi:MAG: HAMP domain-containing sensor histidine kinase [Candidatus Falkowbacteria bacterium]|nr:HAMP domain-containing sensor histidine kinase [Candidatus Falkowbacteria bacterium]